MAAGPSVRSATAETSTGVSVASEARRASSDRPVPSFSIAAIAARCGGGEELFDSAAHDPFQRQLEHFGEALVEVVDDAFGRDRGRPFAHLFDQGPIGMLAALERENAFSVGRFDHQRVDGPLLDGAERFLRLLELGSQRLAFFAKPGKLLLHRAVGRVRFVHGL